MAARKIGIRDVSERASVSMSTVSHVLNGTAPISEEVRRRVLNIASEMGYLAQRQAKGTIAALQRVMIAVPEGALVDSDVNLVSWTILTALTKDCQDRGIQVVPHTLRKDHLPSELVDAAKAEDVSGIILINDDSAPLLKAVSNTGIPAVLINGEDPDMLVDSVTPGNRFAAQKATSWLLEMGHRRIVHLTWPGRKTVRRRLDGFRDAFAEHGRCPADAIVLMAEGYEPHFGEAALADWLVQHPDLDGATAIFCAADNLAFGAVKALQARGLDVPRTVSVMGFDGIALVDLHNPPLTTVTIPLEEFGREALSLLQQRAVLRGQSRAAHRVELGCRIDDRDSVASRSIRMM